MEEVFGQLKCTTRGLSSSEVAQRIKIFGYNKLEEKKVRLIVLALALLPLKPILTLPISGCVMCRKARY